MRPVFRLLALAALLLSSAVELHAQDRSSGARVRLRLPAETPDAPEAGLDGDAAPGSALHPRERERLRRRLERSDARSESPFAAPGSGFEVVVETDLQEYVADPDDPEGSDPIRFFVTSEIDGWLILLTGGAGDDYVVLAPNELLAELPVRAGETLEVPFPAWQAEGVEFVASLPEGLARSQQTVVAVVTRRPVRLPTRPSGAAEPIPGRILQRWLASIPPRERGVGQTLFVVRTP
jgi:hypothetical protein